MFHVAIVVFLSIVAGVGIIGNLFIIGSICLYKRLRVRGHAFVVNLAIADLIIVAYIMPVGLATSQFLVNPFSKAMCEINAFLIMTSCGVSTQTLMLIALERFFHICKMHMYRKAFTPRLIGLYIGVTWVYTSAWTCQGWTGWTSYVYGEHVYLCIFSGPISISYDVCLAFFGMLLPMIVLAVCYFKIFKTVVRSRRAITAHRKKAEARNSLASGSDAVNEVTRLRRPEAEKQVTREYRLIVTLFTIVVVFCACWLPACIVIVMSGVWTNMPRVINVCCMWLAVSNSAVNSVVYGILNKNFRKGYYMVFLRLFCCGHTPQECSVLTTSTNSKPHEKKDLYPVSIWGALCNSAMNSFIYGILNKNFRTGYKQLLQHIFCCMVLKKRGKCNQCQGLLENKDDSNESNAHSTTKHTKASVSPSSQSESSHTRSDKTTPLPDGQTASPDPQQALKYEEEPSPGGPISKQNGTQVITHNQSMVESDRVSLVDVNNVCKTPMVLPEDVYGGSMPSHTGSQSSLIRRSVASESGSVNGAYLPPVSINESTVSGGTASVDRAPPPASASRPRPVSAQREISMSNVVLETKM